jgi:hypothetical protein
VASVSQESLTKVSSLLATSPLEEVNHRPTVGNNLQKLPSLPKAFQGQVIKTKQIEMNTGLGFW